MADAESQALAELVARRRQVIDMIGMEANRRRAHNQRVWRLIDVTLKALQAQLAELDDDIGDTLKRSLIWRAEEDLLTSLPGIGDTTARTMSAQLPELGTRGRRRIAALVGVALIIRDSGQMHEHRAIAGGRTNVRKVLYMATLSATQWTPSSVTITPSVPTAAGPKSRPYRLHDAPPRHP